MILTGGERRWAMTLGSAMICVLGCFAAPGLARGAEQEWTLTLMPAVAAVPVSTGHEAGFGGGGEAHYGVTDAWGVRAALETYWSSGSARAHAEVLSLGATYTLDVVRVLPFFEANLCALSLTQSDRSKSGRFGPQVSAGADYLLNRRWSVGAVARYAFAPLAAGRDDASSHLFTFALRLSYRLL